MRVIRRSTPHIETLQPAKCQETWQLWTEAGMVDTEGRLFRSWTAMEDGSLDMQTEPFYNRSLSKVQHAEPVRVTWQSDTMWREETPHGDVLYEVLRPDSAPQTAPPNKCGSEKSSRLPSAR